jgi:hypothetical protein
VVTPSANTPHLKELADEMRKVALPDAQSIAGEDELRGVG